MEGPPIKDFRPARAEDIVSAIEDGMTPNCPVLLLFDRSLEELHQRFIERFRDSRSHRDVVVVLNGADIESYEGFFIEFRRAVPAANYMGSNLDALDEVLGWEPTSPDASAKTCWVWASADVLCSRDPEGFRAIFEVIDDDTLGRGALPISRIKLVLTGTWAAMGDEASKNDSFLYRVPKLRGREYAGVSAQLVTFRIVGY